MSNVALVGGSGGIGASLLSLLSDRENIDTIYSTYFRSLASSSLGSIGQFGSNTNVVWSQLDVRSEDNVHAWFNSMESIDWVINCSGFLHDNQTSPEKSIAQFNPENFNRNISINCLPNFLLAKHAAAHLKKSERGVFASITAKVGSIEDNRLGGWYSYRASKAAANMALKTIAIEWQRTAPQVRVVALHPGTTDTALSKPFQKNVAAEKLFSTDKTAALLLHQIDQLHEHPTGRFIAYDGEELPW